MTSAERMLPYLDADGLASKALYLPQPPSANRYWRLWRGRLVKSSEARAYQTLVHNAALAAGRRPLAGNVVLRLWWRPTSLRGDLDNRLKVVLDALQGALYVNDKLVSELHAHRLEPAKRGYVLVECGVVGG